MRTRFDEFGKQMVRKALEGHCTVETDVEVQAGTHRLDLWATPREVSASPDAPGRLGMDTQDIVENWRREAIQEGLEQGERKLLLRMLRRRFGAAVDGETERRVAAAPAEQIEVWAERVLSATSLAELLAD
jgi:hypothetical protein